MSNDQLDRNFLSTKHKNEIGAAENNASEQFCPVAFNPTCVYRHGKHTLTLHQSRARSSFLPPASTLLDPVVALLGPGQTEEPRNPPIPAPSRPHADQHDGGQRGRSTPGVRAFSHHHPPKHLQRSSTDSPNLRGNTNTKTKVLSLRGHTFSHTVPTSANT